MTSSNETPAPEAPYAALLPWDEHNQKLRANVHPAAWQNPQPAKKYHLVVVGAGTAGLVAAAGAAGLGAKVALVERELMGGDCLNVGCVPSKAMISSGRVVAQMRHASRLGWKLGTDTEVDFAAVMSRMRRLRSKMSVHDSAMRFRELGVDVFFGDAAFRDPQTIVVDGATLHFRRAVIATGARPEIPEITGIGSVDYLTNQTVFSLTECPARLGVIGSGPIGVELAQAFARLGAKVTLFAGSRGLMPGEDPDAVQIVRASLESDGVAIYPTARTLSLHKTADGVRIVAGGDHSHDLVVDRLLVAAGRVPNVDKLRLKQAGIEASPRGLVVDDYLRTSNHRVYAAGDVCSSQQFTHAADFMARIVVQNALFFGRARFSRLIIPRCTYTSPELAHVGMTLAEAQQRGIAVDTFTQDLAGVDRAILDGEEQGFVRVHVRRGTDRIVGATVVAAHAGDLISEISLAMTNWLGLKRIAATIHPYPTQADAIRKLGDQFNRSRLTPFARKLLGAWFSRR